MRRTKDRTSGAASGGVSPRAREPGDALRSGSVRPAEGRRVCVVVSRFNRRVTERLLEGATQALTEAGVAEGDMDIVWVPGAWELPLAARRAAGTGCDAIVALGCVIRGETAHFEHIGRAATDGLARVQLDSGIPVGLGVLTPDTLEQALARAGGELGNAGAEAARAALAMAELAGAGRP